MQNSAVGPDDIRLSSVDLTWILSRIAFAISKLFTPTSGNREMTCWRLLVKLVRKKKCWRMYLNLRQCMLVCFWMFSIKCFRVRFIFQNANSTWNLSRLTRWRRTAYRIRKTIGIPKLTSVCCLATTLTQASVLCGASTVHSAKELSAMQLPVLSAPTSLSLSPSPSPNFTPSPFTSFSVPTLYPSLSIHFL